ncbi:hypothetical protein GWK47_035176 [Chionoecetes opilio]|uniref:Uncharacterized protein n=1 Tax=Chionoecetes opilio TaxID=41210 RepID=A0A8J4YNG3_CHIOP|nr:hypothetical protein GWK47_035176 [Chionoecetes opilio]
MEGVAASSDVTQCQGLAKPDPPVSNFVLEGADYTTLQNSCSEKCVVAISCLTEQQKAQDEVVVRLAFPKRMVVQHVTHIIQAFLRRTYFRVQGSSEKAQEAVMRRVHYAMQGIIHRYFKRELDKLVLLQKIKDKEMFENSKEDSDDDTNDGRSDDDSSDEDSDDEGGESESSCDGERSEESDGTEEECYKADEAEKERSENSKKRRRTEEKEMVKQFFRAVVARHAEDREGLVSTVEAIYSGSKTVQESLKEGEKGKGHDAREQSRSHYPDGFQDSASGMQEQNIDSSDEENDTKYCHLSYADEDEEKDVFSCCGDCCRCSVDHNAVPRRLESGCLAWTVEWMDRKESSTSGEESEASVCQSDGEQSDEGVAYLSPASHSSQSEHEDSDSAEENENREVDLSVVKRLVAEFSNSSDEE